MQSIQQPKSNGSPKYNASLPQLMQPPRTEAARRPGRRVVPETLKTEMCRALFLTGSCNFEDDCKFFHDPKEAQPRKMDGKFKTVSCSSFSQTGKCKFSDRCSFLHDEQSVTLESGLRKLVYQEAGLVREEIEENLWQWKWIKEPQPKSVAPHASVPVPVQQTQVPIQQAPMAQPQIQQPRVVPQSHPQPLPQPMSHTTAPMLSTMTMAGLPLPMTSGSMPTQAAPVDVQVPGANWRVVFVPQLVNTQSENSFSSSTVQQMLAQVVHQQQQLQQQQNQIQHQQQQLQHQMAMAHLSMTMAQMSGATMGIPSAGLVNMHMTTASAGSLPSSAPTQGQVGVQVAEMQSSTQFTSDLAEDMLFSGEDESAAGSGSQSQSGSNSTATSGVSSGTSTKRDDLSLSRERTLSHNENSTQTEEEQFNLAVSELADRLRGMFEKPGFLLPPDEPKSQPFTAVAGLVVPAASDPATRIRTC